VRDFNGLGTGGYNMTAVSLGLGISQGTGGDGGFIASGVQKSPTISIGDVDIHPFFAVTNDNLVMTVAESTTGSPLTPQIALYDPNGKLLTFNQNATSTTISVLKAPATGMYFLMVRDFNGLATNTGGYKLNLTETPSPTKPTVSVAATDNLAVEGNTNKGTFTITRTNIRALPVTVKYTMSGTASNGTDYTTLSGTVVIPANAASVAVTLTAKTDATSDNGEKATLTLSSNSAYVLGAVKTATVTINDPPPPPIAAAWKLIDPDEEEQT